MRKRVLLALLMVVAIVLTTSCSLIEKNAEVDKQTVIIEVAGQQFTKEQVLSATETSLDYQQYYYQMLGMSLDRTDADIISDARDSAINSLVQQAVVEQKQAEMGTNVFTDEEMTELQASVDETYAGYVDSVKTSYFADTELTGEELDKAVADKMTELGYPTKEALLENQKATKSQEKLKAEIVKDVTVTDEEIQAEYDNQVASAQQTYAETPAQYATDVKDGKTTYYRPAGYRYVKHILFNMTEEQSAAISDLQSQVTSKQSELDTANNSFAALPADAANDTEDEAKTRVELTDRIATLTTELGDLNTKLDAAKEEAYTSLQPKVDEVQAKIAEGQDFDTLVAEYGEDPGMKAEPAMSTGYIVCDGCTTLVSEFVNASMALEKIGDVSPATRSSFGIHIIKYVSDMEEGAVPLEEVKDAISASLLSSKQDSLYGTTVEQWVTEAGTKIYKDRLN